jgi:hypothetical protein
MFARETTPPTVPMRLSGNKGPLSIDAKDVEERKRQRVAWAPPAITVVPQVAAQLAHAALQGLPQVVHIDSDDEL